MTKNKLAFIGHSFHKKTLSNEFFLDFLKDEYEISLFWDESWRGGDRVDIAAISSEFETFVFFQTMYESEDLKTIEEKNITFVPMYDGVYEKTKKSWKDFIVFFNHLKKTTVNLSTIFVPFLARPDNF